MRIIDGLYEEVRDDSLSVSRALTAAGGPLFPPADWYQDPKLDRVTPITVTADGRIKGHIAPWEIDHIGLPPGTKPPRSRSDYAYFKTGVLQLDDGSETTVGQLTLAGGHASMTADANAAVKHYDDTGSAVADVTVGEDEHGIWVSGGIRPGVTDEQIRALRASAPSGDWRPINNTHELVAVCQVNTPGFPVARAMVAGGELQAIVAAGAGYMFELQREAGMFEALDAVNTRVDRLAAIVAGFNPKKKKDDEEAEEDPKEEAAETDTEEAAEDDAPEAKEDPEEKKRADLRAQFKKRNAK